MVWRVWFTNLRGDLRYADICTAIDWRAIGLAHEIIRLPQYGWTGWWMTCWQPLIVPAGHRLPMRHRIRWALRRARVRMRA